jgi:hypothetical protein
VDSHFSSSLSRWVMDPHFFSSLSLWERDRG